MLFCHIELIDTILETRQLQFHLLHLVIQLLTELVKRIQEGFWRQIYSSLLLREELIADLLNTSMDYREELADADFVLLLHQLIVGDELLSNCLESVLRPIIKPIESAAVHKRRKVPASQSQLISDWRHAQDYVELVTQSFNIGLVCRLWRYWPAKLLHWSF